MVSLVGLIITLLAHQDKPLPKWPNLVNINSIVSLFALLMRASTGMVLAEGTMVLKATHSLKEPLMIRDRHKPVKVAMVSKFTKAKGYGTLRLCKS